MDTQGRREFLEMLGGNFVGTLLLGTGSSASFAKSTKRLLQLPEVKIDDLKNPSLAVFIRLSQWITCRQELSMEVAEKIFPLIQAEPWGKEHLVSTYQKIKTSFDQQGGQESVPAMIEAGVLGKGETWFVSHLLTTWYLGIYYHESREPVRVAFEDALVWQAFTDWKSAPGFSSLEPGHWATKPANVTDI